MEAAGAALARAREGLPGGDGGSGSARRELGLGRGSRRSGRPRRRSFLRGRLRVVAEHLPADAEGDQVDLMGPGALRRRLRSLAETLAATDRDLYRLTFVEERSFTEMVAGHRSQHGAARRRGAGEAARGAARRGGVAREIIPTNCRLAKRCAARRPPAASGHPRPLSPSREAPLPRRSVARGGRIPRPRGWGRAREAAAT
jgi:hypothetical protein